MKNLSKEDEYIRQFIIELGTESPSSSFHKSILNRLRPKQTISAYRPVISSLGWKIIGGAIAAIVVTVLLFLPSGGNPTPLFNQIPSVSIPQVAISLPKIYFPNLELSTIVLQSLVVFTLLAMISIITTLKKWKVS